MNILIKSAVQFALFIFVLSGLTSPSHAEVGDYKRTVESYNPPEVMLVNQHGSKVPFRDLIQSDKPVLVNFILVSSQTVSPILAANFAGLQRKLGPAAQNVRLVSISIDPEHDTPKVMKDYLKRFQARPGWDFLTGSRADIGKVMQAFNATMENKMHLYPLTLIKPAGDNRWIRLSGIMSSSELMTEYTKAGKK